uniref:cDNA FLJ50041 n=1 Tax=Homo sapiens TaxID=9606 RepID=B4E2G6_HUMAN|nr:unnamed protein product [Homo sapiens]
MQDTVTTSALLDPSHSSVSTQDNSSTGGHTSSTSLQLSKPSITPVPAKSRNPHPRANIRRMRRIIAEDPEWSLAIVPLLTELCIQHIIRNFQSESVPALGGQEKAKRGARWVGTVRSQDCRSWVLGQPLLSRMASSYPLNTSLPPRAKTVSPSVPTGRSHQTPTHTAPSMPLPSPCLFYSLQQNPA